MNFRSTYFVCKHSFEIINQKKYENGEYLHLKENGDFMKTMNKLSEIKCFKSICENIPNYAKASRIDDQYRNDYSGLLMELKNRLKAIIDLYESMGIDVEEHFALDIHLPETKNITEFKKNIDALEFIFTKCPFLQNENESFQFEGVDLGSTWMRLSVKIATATIVGSMLLNNVAAFVDKCIIIKSHYLTAQQQRIFVENDEIEQKQKEAVLTYIDLIYKRQVDAAIKEMEEVSGHKLIDGEERGRAEQSFEKLEKLLDKGLQIYASIDSPQETKVLFEPLEMKYISIADEIKKLTDKTDESNSGKQE